MKLRNDVRPYDQRARAESTEATGRRIVDAFLTRLMEQWFDEITLDRVAEDAGVTVQTVVRRFGGKEGLLTGSIETMATRINAQRAAPPGNLDQLVDNLIGDYEKTGDAIIRLLALELRHPALKTVLDIGRDCHRQWAAIAFDGQLSRLGSTARLRALDALVIATDVYTWKLMRRDMGRTVRETAATIKEMILATITEFSKPRSK